MITLDADLMCPACQKKLWVERVDYINGAVYLGVWCGADNWHLYASSYALHDIVFHHTVVTKATLERDFTRLK